MSTNQTTGKQDGNRAPDWYIRMPPDAKRHMKEQIDGTWGKEDRLAIVRSLLGWGAAEADAERAATECLNARHRMLLKALSGSFPSGMRVAEQRLSERLPEAMANALAGKATLSAVLMGPTGCGKTTAAALLVLRSAPPSLHWCYATDLAVADRYHRLGDGEPPAIQQAKTARALVLDDIGAESSAALWTVLNHRYHEGLPTIATTGLTREELTHAIGAAAVRRLRDQHAGSEVLLVDCHG